MDQAVQACVLAGLRRLESGSLGEEVDSIVSIVLWAFLRNRLGRC